MCVSLGEDITGGMVTRLKLFSQKYLEPDESPIWDFIFQIWAYLYLGSEVWSGWNLWWLNEIWSIRFGICILGPKWLHWLGRFGRCGLARGCIPLGWALWLHKWCLSLLPLPFPTCSFRYDLLAVPDSKISLLCCHKPYPHGLLPSESVKAKEPFSSVSSLSHSALAQK